MKAILSLLVTVLFVSANSNAANSARPGKELGAKGSPVQQVKAVESKEAKELREAIKKSGISYSEESIAIKDPELLISIKKAIESSTFKKRKAITDEAGVFARFMENAKSLDSKIEPATATLESTKGVKNLVMLSMMSMLDKETLTKAGILSPEQLTQLIDIIEGELKQTVNTTVLAENIFNKLKEKSVVAETESKDAWFKKVKECLSSLGFLV